MKILTLGGAVNVILNLFFVLVCGRSVDGVAAATVLSNALCALLFVRKLMKSELFQLKLSPNRHSKNAVSEDLAHRSPGRRSKHAVFGIAYAHSVVGHHGKHADRAV